MAWDLCLLPLSPPPASLSAIALSLGWLAIVGVKVSSHRLWDAAEWVRVLCPHPWSLPLSLKWCLLPSHHPFPHPPLPPFAEAQIVTPSAPFLKLAFGEEFRTFPLSSRPTIIEGCYFFLPLPQLPFCTITTQQFPVILPYFWPEAIR